MTSSKVSLTFAQRKNISLPVKYFSSSLIFLFTWKWASRYRLLFVFDCKVERESCCYGFSIKTSGLRALILYL